MIRKTAVSENVIELDNHKYKLLDTVHVAILSRKVRAHNGVRCFMCILR